eukprot:GFKZ01011163.1.p1 GENE.GFKZ01011163.1~~GFKZ01011163.1.p1  ORF type:complete len:472 (+),score=90.46 GFKZ01011163.1:72-1487(+)
MNAAYAHATRISTFFPTSHCTLLALCSRSCIAPAMSQPTRRSARLRKSTTAASPSLPIQSSRKSAKRNETKVAENGVLSRDAIGQRRGRKRGGGKIIAKGGKDEGGLVDQQVLQADASVSGANAEIMEIEAKADDDSCNPVKKKVKRGKGNGGIDGNGEEAVKTVRKKRVKEVDVVEIDEERTKEAERDRPWGMLQEKGILKIVTWNVASCRSVVKSGALVAYMEKERADVVCLQETKMTEEAVADFPGVEGYEVFWNHSKKKGYSGVALFLREGLEEKVDVKNVAHGMGLEEADWEGRVIRVEFGNGLVIINAYVPNSGGKLARLGFRTEVFEPAMRKFLDAINKEGKKVIYCGDLNVAHEVIDIHNSKGNQKSAGHTPQERAEFSKLLQSGDGWADTFRRIYPGVRGYTYFSRRFGSKMKEEGKGWRLDYHILDDKSFADGVVRDIYVRQDVAGSDHYPLVLEYSLQAE